MPSSTSSSRRIDASSWGTALLAALVLWALGFAGVELALAARGFHATALDSAPRWAAERRRASALGERALILVGGSRMQLAMDLDTLRAATGLEPVQLAVDGSAFMPVLQELAEDPEVKGLVLVDVSVESVAGRHAPDQADAFLQYHRRHPAGPDWNADSIEQWLSDAWRTHWRAYADGATPLDSIRKRLLARDVTPQYLTMRGDRSRQADYQRVPMPGFYFGRVLRNLAEPFAVPAQVTAPELERLLAARIAQLPSADNRPFLAQLEAFAHTVERITGRGGRVVLLQMPSSGLVRMIEEARYPRALFWDELAARTRARSLNVNDDASLRRYTCPDGSHLDYRDQPAFSADLVRALGIGAPSR